MLPLLLLLGSDVRSLGVLGLMLHPEAWASLLPYIEEAVWLRVRGTGFGLGPILPPCSCVTLSSLLNLSETCFHHL